MSLPKPPKEVAQDRSLDSLAKGFRPLVEQLLDEMAKRGSPAMVGETYRTNARQRFLWGFGREYDDDRGVVTAAKTAGKTLHGYRCAVDIWSKDNPDAPWNPKNPKKFFADLQAVCKKLGLTWGGDWNGNGIMDEHHPDRPHVQHGKCPVTPSDLDAKDHDNGLLAVVLKRWGIEL